MPKTAARITLAGGLPEALICPLVGGRDHSNRRRPDGGATQTTEVRWFLRGDGPSLKGASLRSCTDSYHEDILGDGVSVKSRVGHGAGIFAKARMSVLAPVTLGELQGTPETWVRWELRKQRKSAAQIHVDKVIARRKDVEVVHLVVHGQRWWSVAMRVGGHELPRVPSEIAMHLRIHREEALSCSYPAWLRLRAGLP